MEEGKIKKHNSKYIMSQCKDIEISVVSNQDLLAVASKILTQHYKAFKELAK